MNILKNILFQVFLRTATPMRFVFNITKLYNFSTLMVLVCCRYENSLLSYDAKCYAIIYLNAKYSKWYWKNRQHIPIRLPRPLPVTHLYTEEKICTASS